jgi:hypothetical protein
MVRVFGVRKPHFYEAGRLQFYFNPPDFLKIIFELYYLKSQFSKHGWRLDFYKDDDTMLYL